VLPRPLTIGLTVLISVVWAVNVVVGFIEPDRHDPTINAIFAVVIGAVFALGRKDTDLRAARRRITKVISGDDRSDDHADDRTDNEPEAPDHSEKADS
jgi:hypothetical protein